MRINILSYEPAGGWILYDYAEKLANALSSYANHVHLTNTQLPGYDVTLHINYWGLRQIQAPGLHCTMVTHIDTPEKLALVKAQADAGIWGFCMSEETKRKLTSLTGIARFQSFPPPAMIDAPARFVTVLVASRIYEDGRKNEYMTIDFIHQFPTSMLKLKIIGSGWRHYVSELQNKGYDIEYHEQFTPDIYKKLLKISDYMLVTGFDEGAMSTLDAILYGITPIASAQGFHLEQNTKMHLFSTHDQLIQIAESIINAHKSFNLISKKMTDWQGFAEKHFNTWTTLISSLSDQV